MQIKVLTLRRGRLHHLLGRRPRSISQLGGRYGFRMTRYLLFVLGAEMRGRNKLVGVDERRTGG